MKNCLIAVNYGFSGSTCQQQHKVRARFQRIGRLSFAVLTSIMPGAVAGVFVVPQVASADGAVTCGGILTNDGTPIVCAAPVQKRIEYRTHASPLDVTVQSGTRVELDDPAVLNRRAIELYWFDADPAVDIRLEIEQGASVNGGSATPGTHQSVYMRGAAGLVFDNYGAITHATQNPVTVPDLRHVAIMIRHDVDGASGNVVFRHHEGASITGHGTTPSGILIQSSGRGSMAAQIDGSIVTSGSGGLVSYAVDLRKFNYDNGFGAGLQIGSGDLFVGTGRNSLIDVDMASGTHFGIVAGHEASGGQGAATIVHRGELNVRSGGAATGMFAYGNMASNGDDALVHITDGARANVVGGANATGAMSSAAGGGTATTIVAGSVDVTGGGASTRGVAARILDTATSGSGTAVVDLLSTARVRAAGQNAIGADIVMAAPGNRTGLLAVRDGAVVTADSDSSIGVRISKASQSVIDVGGRGDRSVWCRRCGRFLHNYACDHRVRRHGHRRLAGEQRRRRGRLAHSLSGASRFGYSIGAHERRNDLRAE